MQVVYAQCAGLDVHKKTVVACCRLVQADGTLTTHVRTFATMTAGLLALADWLGELGISHVAMESTGEFWKPVFNLLEATFTVLVVNAQHIKHVPGRKTDVKDAEWIAELLAHGLLRGSFVPPAPQRALRDLTRQRSHLVQERATVVNRMQKVLEWANIKLASVVTDITGVSARAMLEALVAGKSDVAELAELAKGRLRTKRAELALALRGTVLEHHAFMLAQHLTHIDFLDEQIATFDTQIEQAMQPVSPAVASDDAHEPPADAGTSSPAASTSSAEGTSWAAARTLCDEVPGIGQRVAETIIAELGVDMTRFPSASHAASWARLSPGQRESGGKRRSARIGKGNRYLRSALIQAAHAAVRSKDTFLASFYRRLAARRGNKKAIVAVAHKLLVIVYTLLKTGETYQERGAAALDERQKDRLLARMQRRIEQLGYTVSLEPRAAAA
ncbi:MAG: IS110 family transposase [Chloroflexales bacterium]|nr:IS110 family transposase [Chloroflexales bacterium]